MINNFVVTSQLQLKNISAASGKWANSEKKLLQFWGGLTLILYEIFFVQSSLWTINRRLLEKIP